MLLASAPRSTRARWLGVSALALILALSAPSDADAQDGTVYIGGGDNAPDGARGAQGGDNVIVNMDAIDGGRGRAGASGQRGDAGGQPSVEFGEPYRGPAGAMLRFPPKRPPQSQLVVDPEQLPERRRADRDAQPADPTPARKPSQQAQPERDRERDRQRATAEADPTRADGGPDAPSTPAADSAGDPVEVPDTPSFESDPSGGDDTRTARRDQPDAGPSAADGGTPDDLTARPARKPQPPEDRRTAGQPDSDTAGDASQTGTDAATADATRTATAGTGEDADTGSESAAQPSEPADTGAPADGTQTATATPADDGADAGAATSGTDARGGDGTASGTEATGDDGDGGETQTAALPPEGLPEQLRLRFADGSATLNDEAKQQLGRLARVLQDNPRQRVQLMAFAEGTEDTASQARRLSLSRALAVRTYLIDQGIRSTRMDVRALGATADQGPLDRVDIVPADR